MISKADACWRDKESSTKAGTAPSSHPTPLPNGGELRSVRDAANYLTKLPKAQARRTGMARGYRGELMLVAEHGGKHMLSTYRNDCGRFAPV